VLVVSGAVLARTLLVEIGAFMPPLSCPAPARRLRAAPPGR